jgi:hypothetical protein
MINNTWFSVTLSSCLFMRVAQMQPVREADCEYGGGGGGAEGDVKMCITLHFLGQRG